MKAVVFQAEAAAEYDLAIAFYHRLRVGLGWDFQAEVEDTIDQVQANPDRWATIDQNSTRKLSLKRFPYAIIYQDRPDSILIIAVAHHKRQPFYWRDRT